MKDTRQLAVSAYDNHFQRNNPKAMSPANRVAEKVVDVAGYIERRELKLLQSLEHYDELDKKGFEGGAYKDIAVDFAHQLSPQAVIAKTPVTTRAALVGARLISDHLPVMATYQIP